MKKVVVPGNVRHFNVPCFNCGALFEITEPDIQRSKAYQDCSIDYVKCPECGQILFLPEEKKTGSWLEPVNGKEKCIVTVQDLLDKLAHVENKSKKVKVMIWLQNETYAVKKVFNWKDCFEIRIEKEECNAGKESV